MRAPALVPLVIALALSPAFARGQSAEQVEADLASTQAALEKLRDQATSVLDELDAAETEVRAMQTAADQAAAEVKAAEARVAAAQLDVDAARDALIAQLDLLAPRLRARHKLGKARRASLLLSAGSVGELLRLQRGLERVLASDLEMLGLARAGLERLEARRAELEAARGELAQRAEAAAARRAQARARKEQLAALHDALLEEQGLREKTLAELSREQSRMKSYVKGLKPEGEVAAGFAGLKGKLPFPAQGYIEVGFGKVLNPKFNTVTFQNGLDLRAPEGSEVTAVAPGKVVHARALRGYGNLVIVDHGEGFHSLYAHLSEISAEVGASVEQGTALGKVGDTGSLKGAYLYFELRNKGKPVDPKEWLGSPR